MPDAAVYQSYDSGGKAGGVVIRMNVAFRDATAEQFGGVSLAAISKVVNCADSRRNEAPKWNRLLAKLEK